MGDPAGGATLCPICTGPCNPTEQEDPRVAAARTSFFARLPGVAAYPFRGTGKFLFITGVLSYAVCDFVASVSLFGFILIFLMGCYVFAYMMRIITATAGGDDSPPDWPDFTSFWDTIFRPFLFMFGAVAMIHLPVILWWIYSEQFGWDPVSIALVAVGLAYFPMGLVGMAMFDSFKGFSPHIVLPAVLRVLPAYLVSLTALVGLYLLQALMQTYLHVDIPFVASLVEGTVSIYFLMVEMNILGLIYFCNEERLGWFTVPSRTVAE